MEHTSQFLKKQVLEHTSQFPKNWYWNIIPCFLKIQVMEHTSQFFKKQIFEHTSQFPKKLVLEHNSQFLSREIDIQLFQIYTKINMYIILYKSSGFKKIKFSKYATNEKTTIFQRSLKKSGLLLLFFDLIIFHFNRWNDYYNVRITWPEIPPMAALYHCSWYRRRDKFKT